MINGCANRCASNILEKQNIPYHYEITVAAEGVDKVPTLDFDQAEVDRIAKKIAREALAGVERRAADSSSADDK